MSVELIETKVSVGPSHIALGRRSNCYSCPLAMAIDDLLVEGYKAVVSPTELEIDGKIIPLPPDAIQFVHDFDVNCPILPMTFTIPLPRHLLRVPASPMEVRP